MDYAPGVLRWSEILEAHYGLAAGTFAHFESFIERFHPDDRQSLLDAVEKATGGQRLLDLERRSGPTAPATG